MTDSLLLAALAAREHAYAPYSGFQVGAAIKVAGSDQLFAGCNVENASYGGTVCAERAAVFNAVAALGRIEIEALLLVTDTDPAAAPCGLCRQVLNEFMPPDRRVLLANLDGVQTQTTFGELLPRSFGPRDLQ